MATPTDKDRLLRVKAKVQDMAPNQLAQLERVIERTEKIQAEQNIGRPQVRVDRLVEHLRALEAKIEAEPDSPKMEAWIRRCDEYRTSLSNWHEFNQEEPPSGNPGVKVQVPLGVLKMRPGGS